MTDPRDRRPSRTPDTRTLPMTHLVLLRAIGALCAALWLAPAVADDGHDHGPAAPQAGGPTLPRFAASSELFELVGVVDGKRLTLYLDEAATNAPVKDAKLALEIGGTPVAVESHADGEFEAQLAQPLAAGVTPVTATVTTAADSDLLAGEIDIHEDARAETAPVQGWKVWAPWAGAGLLLLLAVGWTVRRLSAGRGRAASSLRAGGVA